MLRIPPAIRPVVPYGLFAASVLLLLYHHLSESVRQLQVDQIAALEQRPVDGRFPSWYGQPEVVGPSPYDWEARWEPKEVVGARGGQGGRKRRVLFLTGEALFLMSSGKSLLRLHTDLSVLRRHFCCSPQTTTITSSGWSA